MTVKQFRKRQEARGESMFKLMFKLMKEDMARRAKNKPERISAQQNCCEPC